MSDKGVMAAERCFKRMLLPAFESFRLWVDSTAVCICAKMSVVTGLDTVLETYERSWLI